MRHKRRVEAATQSRRQTQGRVLIYATLYPNEPIPKGEKLVAHVCGKCDTSFAVIANNAPYCPKCGTHHVHASADFEIAPTQNLVAAKCDRCGSHNGMSRQTASAFDGHMHCVTCGTGLTFQLPRAETSNLGTTTDDQTLEQETNMADVDKTLARMENASRASVRVLAAELTKHLAMAQDDGQDTLGSQDEMSSEQDDQTQQADMQQDMQQQADMQQDMQQQADMQEQDDKEFCSLLDELETEPTRMDQLPAEQLPVVPASVTDDAAAAAAASKNTDNATNQDVGTTAAPVKAKAKAGANENDATGTKVATPAPALEATDVDTPDGANEGADRGLLGGDATVIAFADDEVLDQMQSIEDNPEAQNEVDQQIELSMIAVAQLGGHKTFSVRSSGDQVLAFLGPMHVATLEKASAGENAKIMHSAGFHKAVTATVTESAKTSEALAQLGFAVVKARLPYVKAARAMVERSSRKVQASFDADKANMTKDLQQCMTIAAAALTKGFFAADSNALKSSFYEVLSSAGVKNPAKLIDDVFRRSADTYNSAVLSRALDLMAKPVEVRNSISDAVVASAYITAEQMLQNEQETQQQSQQTSDFGQDEEDDVQGASQLDDAQEQQFAGMRPSTPALASVRRSMSHVSVRGLAEIARAKHGSIFARSII